jgi:hypothetical protein
VVVVVGNGSGSSGGGIDVFGGGVGVICVALFTDNLFVVADFVLQAKGRWEGEEATR